ncbi:putative GAL4-like Zn(II)2Cys6 (or C6 zinc) binuclear cluster DNA-binding domain [Lyophyllum shimeji]|uniref:GAL4-like Zn(II)2Cys6 (Or C6 zinc) binuclear cluster DNA-binding domain n=1 Tax=Lyophyllum shimeji TaxID=47721 RepID=A0A9P3PJW1_LYOSH|nr:putative GAL4-like Zn(II)2Cys6 (or C6 zinc) binuclear cluster DNA-binding domain [Lyophyllum shimeji]
MLPPASSSQNDAIQSRCQASSESTPLQHLEMPASQAASLQCHHEASMPEPEPLSAYARWKLEEEERFYATFPQARYAAHHCNTVSSAYLEGPGYSYDADGQDTIYAEPANINFAFSYQSSYPCYEVVSTPPTLHYSYDYLQHELAHASLPGPSQGHQHASCASSLSQHNLVNADAAYPQTSAPATEMIDTNMVVPSQRPKPSQPEPALMDYLAPSDAPTPSSSSDALNTHDTEKGPSQYQFPSLHDGIMKAESSQLSAPHGHHGSYHQFRRQNYYPTPKPLVRPGWPTVRTPSPRGIRLSPIPPSRRALPRKPPLACLFCRGRKIACGPSDSGSSDGSCNQCQRRSLKCEYPTESRRGMRKKVHSMPTIAPKARIGRRSRTTQLGA